MAGVNFRYRSNKKEAPLNLRLQFRVYDNNKDNHKDSLFEANTQFVVSKDYWKNKHPQTKPKDIDIVNEQLTVNAELNNIKKHILNAFNIANVDEVNKEWLQLQIEQYYNPPTAEEPLPNELIKYIDKYLEFRRNDFSTNSVRKANVTKHKLIRFQAFRKKVIFIKDVDLEFKTEYEDYCISENYAHNTIAREVRFIKTVCNHAKYNGIEANYQLERITAKYKKTEKVYLNEDELNTVEKKQGLKPHLENAKDWLLISCYTGQRVSDFMRFNKEMIRYENNKENELKAVIEFTQKKTNKDMTVPLHPKVIEILDKRNGEFPNAISDQKYNTYIKEVCLQAGLTNKVKGSKKIETSANSKKYRKVSGMYEKWELVTSHIGRRSFATNFYGKIPTSYLIYVTGHSSEALFRTYLGKNNKDTAMELTYYF
jgi:integrase